MVDFAWSWAWLFLPLPLLIYFFFPKFKREEPALRVPSLKSFNFHSTSNVTKERPNILRIILLLMAWLSLVIAAARPQLTGEPINLPVTGRDIMRLWMSPGQWEPKTWNLMGLDQLVYLL